MDLYLLLLFSVGYPNAPWFTFTRKVNVFYYSGWGVVDQLCMVVRQGVGCKEDLEYLTALYANSQAIFLFHPSFSEIPGVLYFRFCYYSDQETISIEKVVCYSQLPRERGMPHHTQPQAEALGWSEGRRNEGKMPSRAFIVVFMKDMEEAG